MKTKKSAAGAEAAKVTLLKGVQKEKNFSFVKQEKNDVVDVQPIEETTPVEEAKPVVETTPVVEIQTPTRRPASMEDYKTRISRMHELTIKHNRLTEKLDALEMFEVKKDNNTATVKIWDIRNVSFESNDPASLHKIVEVVRASYQAQIADTERLIFDLMTA